MSVVLRNGRFIIRFYDDAVTPDDVSKALREVQEYFSGEAGRLGEYEFLVFNVYNTRQGRCIEKEGVVAIIPLL